MKGLELQDLVTPKMPGIVRSLYPGLTWNIQTSEKVMFLTFDDGPSPSVTPHVLDQLKEYDAKATFFCIGEKVRQAPNLFKRIQEEGHAIGNHTDHHLNGKKVTEKQYYQNVACCSKVVRSELFRPPYGKITRSQAKGLGKWYRIIMWDILSADFDERLSGPTCSRYVREHAGAGSIVVFHDSEKAWERLNIALPEVLHHFSEQGYAFEALTPEVLS